MAQHISQRMCRDRSLRWIALVGVAGASGIACNDTGVDPAPNAEDGGAPDAAQPQGGTGGDAGFMEIDPNQFDGREVFRHDTFGDERFWTDQLRMHEVSTAFASASKNGDKDRIRPGSRSRLA